MRKRCNTIIRILVSSLLVVLLCSCEEKLPFDHKGEIALDHIQKLSISNDDITINSNEESSFTLLVSSTGVKWAFSNIPDWITVNPTSGDNSQFVNVSVSKQTNFSARVGTFLLISLDNPCSYSKEIRVSQRHIPNSEGYEYVDLGLSVLWATCNVGASKPEDYGDYYAWGETYSKSSYTWSNYKYWLSGDSEDSVKVSKYNLSSSRGTVDNKTTLDLIDDVAHVKWGGDWRLPTMYELIELGEECSWTWTTRNGINGYLVKSNMAGYTDNSIFLPAANTIEEGLVGMYWTNSLDSIDDGEDVSNICAVGVIYDSKNIGLYSIYRYAGAAVRPVCQ